MTPTKSPLHIVLGVCGSVASYKAQELCRELIHHGATVQTILTPAAEAFVTPLSFQALSGKITKTDLFEPASEAEFDHITLARWADLVLIAPASADFITKAALGLGSDYLSTLLLACKAPLYFAPAMNYAMWEHPAIQGHVQTLKQRGAIFIGPDEGLLACGEEGAGRLADLAVIINQVTSSKADSRLQGKKILITAGPTIEPIDPVRYLSNRSSGKMGYALAEAAADLGAQVQLISGPVQIPAPKGVSVTYVQSTDEMHQAVLKEFHQSHLTLMCAAVADYRIQHQSKEKLKKKQSLTLELTANVDILAELGAKKQDWQVLIGFAAETQDLLKHAKMKQQTKKVDWIIGNDVSQPNSGFDTDTNQVVIVNGSRERELGPLPKKQLAKKIFQTLLDDPNLGPKLLR